MKDRLPLKVQVRREIIRGLRKIESDEVRKRLVKGLAPFLVLVNKEPPHGKI